MSADQLATARTLIQQKRYSEARTILETVNHPTATKWLAKLNEIDPPDPPMDDTISPPTASGRSRRVGCWTVLSIILIVLLVATAVYQHIRLNNLSRDVSELITVVNSHASDLQSLSYDLSSVSRIANNANQYAHSHGYSDAALKTDVAEIDDPLGRILSLRGMSFLWNSEAYPDLRLETGRDYGVMAQDLALVFPELVTADAETGYLRVDYEGLIPVLIEAIREQQRQIDGLQALQSE